MTGRATLYTSLPPKLERQIANDEVGHSYLAECVTSWKKSNFEVVSLNSADEIRLLESHGYDVEYQEVPVTRPRISDFLRTIRAAGRPVAGIINADVFLPNNQPLLDAVMDHAASGMVVAERANINPRSLRLTWQTCNGFDAFIFSTAPLSRIDLDCDLSFGEPLWDYWFPLAYLAVGGRLITTRAPLIFHLDHVQKWRNASWIESGEKIIKYLLRSTGQLPEEFVAQTQKFSGSIPVSEDDLRSFSYWCFAWLRRVIELNKVSPPATAPVSRLVALINDPEVCNLIGELNEAQASIVNSKEVGAKALLESLNGHLPNQGTAAERGRVLAGLYREIQNISDVVCGRKVTSGEDALSAVTEGARILTSRKGSLLHFLALNALSFRRKYLAIARALKTR